MNDCLLEVLGDYFVQRNLAEKGWEFHEFIREWHHCYVKKIEPFIAATVKGSQVISTY